MLDISREIALIERALEQPYGMPPLAIERGPGCTKALLKAHWKRNPKSMSTGYDALSICLEPLLNKNKLHDIAYHPQAHAIVLPGPQEHTTALAQDYATYVTLHEIVHGYNMQRNPEFYNGRSRHEGLPHWHSLCRLASEISRRNLMHHTRPLTEAETKKIEKSVVLHAVDEGIANHVALEILRDLPLSSEGMTYLNNAERKLLFRIIWDKKPQSNKTPVKFSEDDAVEALIRSQKVIEHLQSPSTWSDNDKKINTFVYGAGYQFVRAQCERSGNLAKTVDEIIKCPPRTLRDLTDGIMSRFRAGFR